MHGGVELYCLHAGCSRAEGGGQPFTRKEDRAGHVQRKHNEQDTTSSKSNNPIAPSTWLKRKQELSINDETVALGETALLNATTKQLQRRVEQLEEARFGQQFLALEG